MEKIQEICKCSICLDLFNEPIVSSCGHVFCKNCLSDYQFLGTDVRSKKCPICNKEMSSYSYECFPLKSILDILNLRYKMKNSKTKKIIMLELIEKYISEEMSKINILIDDASNKLHDVLTYDFVFPKSFTLQAKYYILTKIVKKFSDKNFKVILNDCKVIIHW